MEIAETCFKMLDLKVESDRNGCGFCMEYDWSIRQEKPSSRIKEYRIDNRVINYCPFCGRKLN